MSRALAWMSLALIFSLPFPLQAEDWDRLLDSGEILVYTLAKDHSDTPEVVVKAVIDAPPRKVWQVVSRCGDYVRTMVRIKAARELSRRELSPGGEEVVCRVTVDMPFPYSDMTATTRVLHTIGDGHYTRRWQLLHGDYKSNSGSWELRPFRGDRRRTMAVYRAHAEPKAWIPGWIRNTAQKSTLPEMIRKIRRLVSG